ncbi:MAG: M1 family aminopeptidase [Thermoplasmata archaeon]
MLEYDVALDIDYDAASFHGTVEIDGFPKTPALELDSVDLEIQSVHRGSAPVPHRLDAVRHKLVVELDPASLGPLRVAFSGRAGEGVQTGLFVSRLGAQKALSTQMEPEGCRRLLPCFDRPDQKGIFRLRVTTRGDLAVLANMPGECRPTGEGRREWRFAPTPAMSTYLLYLGVGPFEEATDTGPGEPPVILAGPPGSRTRAARALRDARASLRALREYFDLPYPLPKLHLIALSDFWVGMENWGAITGGENHYLLDETTAPIALRFGEQTIVHEIAHQWFGDLVTLESWDDLWLNEAFATFITPRIQERAGVRRDPWGEFVLFTARGDPVDSLWATHPVKPEGYDPAEIMATADFVTYFKGSRLLRMVEAYLGEEVFRRGLSAYLRRHQFGNARSRDLWRALEEVSGRGVVDVMQQWVERPGFPVISVVQVDADVELSQRRFTYLRGPSTDPPWPIPLTVDSGAGPRAVLFDGPRLTLPGASAETLRLDPGRAGFYRILWESPLRARAIEKMMTWPPLDRWGFLHDARAFLLSGDYSLDEYLALLHAVRDATDLVTVEEVAQSLHVLGPILSDVPAFGAAAREFCRAQLDRIGEVPRPGEPESNDTMRDWVAWMRVPVDDDYARSLAPRFAAVDREPPAMRQAIATAYARWGPSDALDRLMERAVGADSDAAGHACWAIEGFRDPALVDAALERGRPSVRLADLYVRLVWGASKNPDGRAVLWPWLTTHLRELERRAQGTYLLAYMLDGILPSLGVGREEEVGRYFAAERFPEGAIGIRTGLETLEAARRLRERIGAKTLA